MGFSVFGYVLYHFLKSKKEKVVAEPSHIHALYFAILLKVHRIIQDDSPKRFCS